MKILHVCSNYFPASGGPQYTMKHLSENLVSFYNDEVEVATSNSFYGPEMNIFKKIVPAAEIINKVKVFRYSFTRWHYGLITFANKVSGKLFKKSLPYFIMKHRRGMYSYGIEKKMSELDTDVIMATTANYMFCDYPLWRHKTKHAKPFVLYGSIHLHYQHEVRSPLIKRSKICDVYIANTEFERLAMIGYGVDENKIVTIGTGIDITGLMCDKQDVLNWRNQNNINDDDVLIGHMGRLSKGKGTLLLLQAFSKIYKENKKVKLILAGTKTADVAELKQFINKESLPVIVLENFDHDLKPILFNALDIFVLASQGESFGVVFLEAWSCRKPVIGVDNGAIATIIDDGQNGLLYKAGDVNDLNKKIVRLVNNKSIRNDFGDNGYQKALIKYNWRTITEKYRSAYLKAIQNFNNDHYN